MKKFKWNRFYTILVLLMFITMTYASVNTNLFIDGKGYVRVEEEIRITDVQLIESESNAYEAYEPSFTKNTVTINANLPKQASTQTYQVTIKNSSNYDFDIQEILEETYSNTNISYEITGVQKNTLLEANTTTTFTIRLFNNTTIEEEEDAYQTEDFTFDYTGSEQEFIVPYDGDYTIEVWGAQGGSANTTYSGGYGGYSTGTIHLKQNQKIYINVGGTGQLCENDTKDGGYNGGGACTKYPDDAAEGSTNLYSSGGGATHIAFASGELNKLEDLKGSLVDNQYYLTKAILIVAGGGGGGGFYRSANNTDTRAGKGGAGGGFVGNPNTPTVSNQANWRNANQPTGGTQISGGTPINTTKTIYPSGNAGSFGQGGSANDKVPTAAAGGGGGFYGGSGNRMVGGTGGSGYIANPSLTNKSMYCYQCTESEQTELKTISTENHSETPISNYAKEGNGYAKLSITRKVEEGTTFAYDYSGEVKEFITPYRGIYKLEAWGAQGGTLKVDNSRGGYGAYAKGDISLTKGEKIYIATGGAGIASRQRPIFLSGGWNGGGDASTNSTYGEYFGSGGGATHFAITNNLGELKNYIENKEDILLVAGGGGGAGNNTGYTQNHNGGSGGGYIGNAGGCKTAANKAYGGTQTEGGAKGQEGSAGSFGAGASYNVNLSEKSRKGAGGGGGYYGGGSNGWTSSGGAGGSGYIGNERLTNKVMFCFKCSESSEEDTKTVTTQAISDVPQQNNVKTGNGYAKITLQKRINNYVELELKFEFEKFIKTDITYDYQYPYNFFKGNKSTSYSNFSEEDTENVCSGEIGKIYFTNWKYGDNIEFDYDVAYTDLTPVSKYVSYEMQVQGKGNNTGWSPKLVSYRNKTYIGTGSMHINDTRTLTSSYFGNDYYAMNLRFDDYVSGKVTVSNIVAKRIAKDTITRRANRLIGELPTPDYYNDDYQFLGWFDSPTEGNRITESEMIPESNVTYYAHWSNGFDINYDLDGGELENAITHYIPSAGVSELPTPTKEEYDFIGWTGGKNLFNGTLYKRIAVTYDGAESNDNKTYMSDFIAVDPSTEYTVSNDSDVSMFVLYYDSEKAYKGYDNKQISTKTFITPSNCSYVKIRTRQTENVPSNYPNIKIQLEKGNRATAIEDQITTPQNPLTITTGQSGERFYQAHWTKKYEIEYDLNDGSLENPITSYNETTNSFTLPNPTKEGYIFTGWTGGKNLFTVKGAMGKNNGVTPSVASNGTISFSGTPTTSWVNATVYTGPIKPGTYTLSRPEAKPFSINIKGSDNGTTVFDFGIRKDETTRTSTITKEVTYYTYLASLEVGEYVSDSTELQLEKGSVATAFERYIKVPQTSITIPKGSAGNRLYNANWEVKGIGDYNLLSGWVSGDDGTISSEDPYARYDDPYYTKLIKLEAGKTYTINGVVDSSDVRWRKYDLYGKYNANIVEGLSITPEEDCYARVLIIQNVTESVKENFSITITG